MTSIESDTSVTQCVIAPTRRELAQIISRLCGKVFTDIDSFTDTKDMECKINEIEKNMHSLKEAGGFPTNLDDNNPLWDSMLLSLMQLRFAFKYNVNLRDKLHDFVMLVGVMVK